MPRMVMPREHFNRLIRSRRRSGADRFDEVWDGVYVMPPPPDNLHQLIATGFAHAVIDAIGCREGVRVLLGSNISDRVDHWERNYRWPDLAVFLPGNTAQDCQTHWLGGPDFAAEVLTRGDRARKKLPFYASVGVRELLLIDRNPWRLELYLARDGRLELVATADPGSSDALTSLVLPLNFRLLPEMPHPRFEVSHQSEGRAWCI